MIKRKWEQLLCASFSVLIRPWCISMGGVLMGKLIWWIKANFPLSKNHLRNDCVTVAQIGSLSPSCHHSLIWNELIFGHQRLGKWFRNYKDNKLYCYTAIQISFILIYIYDVYSARPLSRAICSSPRISFVCMELYSSSLG